MAQPSHSQKKFKPHPCKKTFLCSHFILYHVKLSINVLTICEDHINKHALEYLWCGGCCWCCWVFCVVSAFFVGLRGRTPSTNAHQTKAPHKNNTHHTICFGGQKTQHPPHNLFWLATLFAVATLFVVALL